MERNNYEKYLLRDYQIQSCEELQEKITGDIPLLLVMPTGTGKTRTAISFCLELLDARIVKNIIWVAHRYELINQAKETLKLCCSLKYGNDWEKYNEISFGFSMNTTFRDMLNQVNDETLVVYDEAHHCVSKNSTYCLDDVKRKKAKILGLTATPFRTDDDIPFVWEFTKEIGENAYNDVITRAEYSIVEKITISTAIFKKYLCRFQIFGMRDIYEDLKNEWEQNTDNWSDYYNSKLEKTIISIIADKVDENNEDAKILPRPKDGKILIFSKRADRLYRRLLEEDAIGNKGIGLLLSNHYEYRKPRSYTQLGERSEIISLYSKDDENESLSILINNAILTEGFDEPKVTDIILLYDTNSGIRMTQILGRGLRPYGDEKRGCYVYNFANADVINKIYNGNQDFSNLKDLDNLDILLGELGEQIAVTGDGKIIISSFNIAGDENNEAKAVFPKNVIYDYIRASRLGSEFKLAGFLIAEELFQCFVSQQELQRIEKGEIPSRYHTRFQEMLKNMIARWNRVEAQDKERFDNSFIKYLISFGKYKSMDDCEIDDINNIDKNIENRMLKIRKKVNDGNKIVASIEEVFSEEGISPTPSDIEFYGHQVFLSLIGEQED